MPTELPNNPNRDELNGVEKWLRQQIEYYTDKVTAKKKIHDEKTPEVKEYLYWLIALPVALVLLFGAVAGAYYWMSSRIEIGPVPLDPRYFVYGLVALYVIASFRKVDVDKVAGADFFGKPAMQFTRGLKWVPLFLLTYHEEYATYVQSEFPGDADRIQWTDEKVPLEPGKVRPIYVLSDENPKGILPTEKQMNLGMSALAKFQLISERFFDLVMKVSPIDAKKRDEILATITGGENTTEKSLEVVRHLRDTSAGILREIAGKLSFHELNQHLNLVNELLQLRLQETVIEWGIDLVEARITNVNPGHDFNDKIQIRSTSIADRDAKITLAEGEKQRLILEGEGSAAAELASLRAKAKGYAKIAQTAGVSGEMAISAETAAKLAAAGNTVVVGTDGVKDLIGIVAAAKRK